LDIKIPEERVGVLVGPGGSMKRLIEEKTKTTLEIDSETGAVRIASAEDPLQGLRVLDLVKAIGRGFSPERAIAILDDDMLMLDILDLSKMAGTKSDMERIKGRIIGKDHGEALRRKGIGLRQDRGDTGKSRADAGGANRHRDAA
jgi:ribosomal RNA assembly protein